MKVVQVVGYHQNLKLTEAPEPKITNPLDVIVKIGAAGVCRTDLHILEGQWEEKAGVKLPYTVSSSSFPDPAARYENLGRPLISPIPASSASVTGIADQIS